MIPWSPPNPQGKSGQIPGTRSDLLCEPQSGALSVRNLRLDRTPDDCPDPETCPVAAIGCPRVLLQGLGSPPDAAWDRRTLSPVVWQRWTLSTAASIPNRRHREVGGSPPPGPMSTCSAATTPMPTSRAPPTAGCRKATYTAPPPARSKIAVRTSREPPFTRSPPPGRSGSRPGSTRRRCGRRQAVGSVPALGGRSARDVHSGCYRSWSCLFSPKNRNGLRPSQRRREGYLYWSVSHRVRRASACGVSAPGSFSMIAIESLMPCLLHRLLQQRGARLVRLRG